jgi:hypothetical protein
MLDIVQSAPQLQKRIRAPVAPVASGHRPSAQRPANAPFGSGLGAARPEMYERTCPFNVLRLRFGPW